MNSCILVELLSWCFWIAPRPASVSIDKNLELGIRYQLIGVQWQPQPSTFGVGTALAFSSTNGWNYQKSEGKTSFTLDAYLLGRCFVRGRIRERLDLRWEKVECSDRRKTEPPHLWGLRVLIHKWAKCCNALGQGAFYGKSYSHTWLFGWGLS